jgi:hypothetical protein
MYAKRTRTAISLTQYPINMLWDDVSPPYTGWASRDLRNVRAMVARLLARLEGLRSNDVSYTIASEECRCRELLLSVLEVDRKLVTL